MSTSNTQTLESDDEPTSTPSRAIDFITRRIKDGSLPLLAGTSLFVRTVQKRENRGRMLVRTLTGTALVGIGLRQRRSQRNRSQPHNEHDGHDRNTGTSEERAESHRPDTNPRGTSNEPDVETETEPDEGSIQFTESQESQPNPDLDEIDLSDASMADEASEAVGPTSGQSQPTQIDEDDTEPEGMSQKESSHWSEMDDADDEESKESR